MLGLCAPRLVLFGEGGGGGGLCSIIPNFSVFSFPICILVIIRISFRAPPQSYIKILSVRALASTPIFGYSHTVSSFGPDLGHVITDHRPRGICSPADDLFCAAIISPILLLHSTEYDARLDIDSSRGRFLITIHLPTVHRHGTLQI